MLDPRFHMCTYAKYEKMLDLRNRVGLRRVARLVSPPGFPRLRVSPRLGPVSAVVAVGGEGRSWHASASYHNTLSRARRPHDRGTGSARIGNDAGAGLFRCCLFRCCLTCMSLVGGSDSFCIMLACLLAGAVRSSVAT